MPLTADQIAQLNGMCPASAQAGGLGTLISNLIDGIVPNGSISAAELASNSVETAKIKDANVTYAKIQNVSATNRLLGRSTAAAGVMEEITVGGDLSQSGSNFTIANGAVTALKCAAAVQSSLGLADTAYQKPGTGIPTTDLANAAVDATKLAGSSVSLPKLLCASGELTIDAAGGTGAVTLEGYGATFRVYATLASAPAGSLLRYAKTDGICTFAIVDAAGAPIDCSTTNAVLDYMIFDV